VTTVRGALLSPSPRPWNRTTLVAALVLVFVVLLPAFHVPGVLTSAVTPRLLLVTALGFLLSSLLALELREEEGALALRVPRPLALLAVYGLYSLMSASWAIDRGSALVRAVTLTSGLLFAGIGAGLTARDPSFPARVVPAAVWAGAGASLLALLQSLGLGAAWFDQAVAPAATFGNKNVLAQYVGVLIFPALGLVATARGRQAFWRAIPAALLLGALLLTRTRGAWLAAGATAALAGLWLAVFPADRRVVAAAFGERTKLGALAVALVAALAIGGAPSTLPRQTLLAGPDSMYEGGVRTASVRLAIYRDTLAMIQAHPFGVGLGSWRAAFPPFKSATFPATEFSLTTQPWEAHSDVIETFAESGVPGGLLFLGLFAALLVGLAPASRRTRKPKTETTPSRLWSLLLAAGVCEAAAHSLVDFPFQRPASAALAWLWFGVVAASTARQGRDRSLRWDGVPLAAKGVLSGLLFAGLLLAGRFMVSLVASDRALLEARRLESRGDYPAAVATLSRAAADFPHSFLLNRMLAADAFYAQSQGKLDPAVALGFAGRVLRSEPSQPRALLFRGYLALKLGDHELAAQSFGALARILPDVPDTQAALRALDRPPR
jgi:O-antigen ligase